MLILLNASKNRIGSFTTPSIIAYSVNITATAANAFKYGNFLNSTLVSFQKGTSSFKYGQLFTSVNISSFGGTSFTSNRLAQSSSKISSTPSWYLFYPKTPVKAFYVSNGVMGLFISPKTVEKSFILGFDPTISLVPGTTINNGFTLYSDAIANMLFAPASSGVSQTLVFQPE